jgi:plasmid stability protein
MAQVLIRNIPEETLSSFRQKAELKGKSLEQELRDLLEQNRKFTPEERAALADHIRQGSTPSPALSLDDIREGLE